MSVKLFLTGSPFLFLGFFISATGLFGQDLNKLNKEEWIKIGGGLSTRFEWMDYGSFSPERNGFNQVYSGNLDIQILGVSLPMNFQYSDRKWNNSPLPFNRSSFHPTYKKWSSSIGTFSPHYGNYSLSGKLLKGGELVFDSERWKWKVTGGKDIFRLTNSVLDNKEKAFLAGISNELKLGKVQLIQSLIGSVLENNSSYIPGSFVISNGVRYHIKEIFRFSIDSDVSFQKAFDNHTNSLYPQTHIHFNGTSQIKQWNLGVELEHTDKNYSSPGILFLQKDMQRVAISNEWRAPSKGIQLKVLTGIISYGIHKPIVHRKNQLDLRYNFSARIKKRTTISSQGMNNISYSIGQLQQGINLYEDSLKWIRTSSNYSVGISHRFSESRLIKNITLNTQAARSTELVSSLDETDEDFQKDPLRWNSRMSVGFCFLSDRLNCSLQLSAIGVEQKTQRFIAGLSNNWTGKNGWGIGSAFNYQLDLTSNIESFQEVLSISYRPKKLKDFNFLINGALSQQGTTRSHRLMFSLNYRFGK